MIKKQKRAKVLKTIDFFQIKQIPVWEMNGTKKRMKSSTIAIFHGKKQLKDGFKNTETAIDFIKESKYNMKTKSFV
jgi:hypothetical protein